MHIIVQPLSLTKRFPLTISRGTAAGSNNLLVTVTHDGITGQGEFSPVGQTVPPETALTALEDLRFLSEDIDDLNPYEMQRIETVANNLGTGQAAFCALEMALHDWLGHRAGLPVYRLLGADPARIVPTSVTVGINPPEVVRERVPELLGR